MKNGIALICVCLLAPGAAAADIPSQPLQVNADVPVRCKLSTPSAGMSLNTSFSPNGNGGDIALTQLVDPNTSMTQAAEGSVLVPITCTGAHTLTVTSRGGLTNQNATAAGGFATHVNYALTASWGGTTETSETSGSALTLDVSQGGPQTGNLTIAVSLPPGRGPLVAGTYTDEIVIQLNAQ